jgi:hypothetical protein
MQEGRPNLGPTFATAVRMCRRREACYWDSFDKAMIFTKVYKSYKTAKKNTLKKNFFVSWWFPLFAPFRRHLTRRT